MEGVYAMIDLSVQEFLVWSVIVSSSLLIFVNLLHKYRRWRTKHRQRKSRLICRLCGYHFLANPPENICPHCITKN